jgi:hypothetical protein
MYIYVYIYIYTFINIYRYIYTYKYKRGIDESKISQSMQEELSVKGHCINSRNEFLFRCEKYLIDLKEGQFSSSIVTTIITDTSSHQCQVSETISTSSTVTTTTTTTTKTIANQPEKISINIPHYIENSFMDFPLLPATKVY